MSFAMLFWLRLVDKQWLAEFIVWKHKHNVQACFEQSMQTERPGMAS
jgi:hypothetical protein